MRLIADKNEWATFHLPELTSEEGRTIPYLLLSNNLQTQGFGSARKLRIWMQGGVHGNEPAGDQSLLALMGKLDADQAWTFALLKVMDIVLLPRYNPDGVADYQRLMTSSIDGNRDHIKLSSQQTCDIKAIFSSFAPHITVDMHEYSASQVYGGNYQIAADALFSAAKNLNIHPAIREMSETLFTAQIGKSLEEKGFRWGPYVTGSTNRRPGSSILFNEAGSDGKIGRNAMGLTQSIAFLCETRGIGLADQHFRRRTAAALTIAETILQIAADNASNVYDTIEEAIRTFINSRDHIVLTDQAQVIERTFTMIDNRDGLVSPVPIQLASTTPVMAQTTRSRPEAYLIPSVQTNVAQRLEQLGMVVRRLNHCYRCDVEVLHITSVSFGSTYYEGIVPVTVKVKIESKRMDVPPGTYLVSTRQKNAALAFIALEPENIDSYVSSNIIPVEEGNEYPILRIMREHST